MLGLEILILALAAPFLFGAMNARTKEGGTGCGKVADLGAPAPRAAPRSTHAPDTEVSEAQDEVLDYEDLIVHQERELDAWE